MLLNIEKVNASLAGEMTETIIRWAGEIYGSKLVISSSFGTTSAPLLHLVTRILPDIPVIFIDTGYLFPETHRYREQLTSLLKLNVKSYASPLGPEQMEAKYGKLWERKDDKNGEGLALYHQIRKIEPMKRALRELGAEAVIYGIRASQTSERSAARHVEREKGTGPVYRIHPILRWTDIDIGSYFLMHDLPYHPLTDKGYDSVGDMHTTLPGKGREGRLLGPNKECGLHTVDYEI